MRQRVHSDEPEEQSAATCVRVARGLLTRGMLREAYNVLQPAMMKYTSDPFVISYFGYLTVAVAGRHRQGIEDCKRAVILFEKIWLRHTGQIDDKLKAVLYLNLGKAYLASDRKKDAYETLQKGLRYDTQNRELLRELESMGVRKFTPLPFLDRSNPLNVLVGRMLRKSRQRTLH